MEKYKKGILYAIITALLWSVLAIGLKVAVRVVEPVTIVWFRFSIAFFFLLIFQLFRNRSELKIFIKPPWILVFATICLAWNYLGFMLGIQYTSPTIAQIFVQAAPISLALIGVVFFREKISTRQITGFALAIVGLLIFYYQQFGHIVGAENEFKIGVLLTVSSAFAWAIYASIQKKLVIKHTTSSLNLFVFGFSVILFLPFIDLSSVFELQWTYLLLLVFLGLNTLISYGTLSMALKYLEASKVSIIIILNPILTFIIMAELTYLEVWWIAGEKFTLFSILGAFVVLAGAILVVLKKK